MLTFLETGECIMQLAEFESPTTVAVWTPDGQHFIVGSLDTKHAIELWNVHEELVYRWKDEKLRVYDLALSPDGQRLVALLETRIIVYDFVTRQKVGDWTVDDGKMTSLAISQDSQMMLIGSNPNRIRLLRIDTGELVQTFEGHKQKDFMIRSAFGGANQTFVISGSEGWFYSLLPGRYPTLILSPFRFSSLRLANHRPACRVS
jgi:WD40 repeat protein